jgi:hypothetical protein
MMSQGLDICTSIHEETISGKTITNDWSTFLNEDSDTTDPAEEVIDESDEHASGPGDSDDGEVIIPRAAFPATHIDEDGFIDIEPEEGQRRGRELLAMLLDCASSEHSSESVPALPPPPPPTSSHLRHKLSAGADMFVPQQYGSTTVVNFQHSAYTDDLARDANTLVQEAALYAFGADLDEVIGDADDGIVVKVRSTVGYWDVWTALSALGTALGSYLGREIVSLEPDTADTESEHAMTKLHCVKAGADVNGQCWEHFCGTCPRGARCRWGHDLVIVNVEVKVEW